VGGAATDSTGFYRVPITAGISRADTFLIEVKTRERRLLVGEALCEVNTTPSPVPALQLAPEAPTALVIPSPVNPPPGVQNTSVPQTVPGAGVEPTQSNETCSPAYVGVCIPPPPPELSCSEIRANYGCSISVVSFPDPHNLDRDEDGIACECE
jgi:hypothetical protein